MRDTIIKIAQTYIGQKELGNNAGFSDKAFEDKMKTTGWSKGQSWCAYFTELVWREAYKKTPLLKSVIALFSASATATFDNFAGSSLFKTGTTPQPGALVVWRYGNTWRGHIGIVETINNNGTFVSIEGNTNAAGEREGIEVARKVRRIKEIYKAKGLNLIGFVYPTAV